MCGITIYISYICFCQAIPNHPLTLPSANLALIKHTSGDYRVLFEGLAVAGVRTRMIVTLCGYVMGNKPTQIRRNDLPFNLKGCANMREHPHAPDPDPGTREE